MTGLSPHSLQDQSLARGVPWDQDGSAVAVVVVVMVSTLWALPVLRPVILTRREGDKAQPATVFLSLSLSLSIITAQTCCLSVLPPTSGMTLVGFPPGSFSVSGSASAGTPAVECWWCGDWR